MGDSSPRIEHVLQRTGEQSGSSGLKKASTLGRALHSQKVGRWGDMSLICTSEGAQESQEMSQPPETQAQAAKTGCKERPCQQVGKHLQDSP